MHSMLWSVTYRQEIGSAENFSNLCKDKQLLICSLNKKLRLAFSLKTFSRWTQQTQGKGQLNYSYLCYYLQLPKELLCSKRLPLYTFSSFKARTEFPKGKGIRELPEHIMQSIKNKCERVLENYNLQSQNAGTLPSTNARHTAHAT